MADKRLIIVIDSAAELGSHWKTILTDYLERIIRYFDYEASTSQGSCGTKSMLGLSVYSSQGPYYEVLVQPSGWTSDVESFIKWLSGLSFTSVGFDEAALAKGLSSALQMIAAAQRGSETQLFGQSHCILVASSNSNPLFRPFELPKDPIFDYGRISDAESVAKLFVQGNVNKRGVEFMLNDDKNRNYLILLSDNFMEAHAALIHDDLKSIPAIENHQGIDFGTYLVPPFQDNWSDEDFLMIQNIISGPLPASQHNIPTGNILTAAELELLLMDDKYEEIIVMSESMTGQKEFLAENIPTTSAQQMTKNEKSKSVNDMMKILKEAINQSAVTDQREHVAENDPWTAPEQQKHEREQYEDDGTITIFGGIESESTINWQEIPKEDITTFLDLLQSEDYTSRCCFITKDKPWDYSSSRKFKLSKQCKSTQSFAIDNHSSRISSESQMIGSEYKSSHQAMWSLTANSEALVTTHQSAQYATTCSLPSAFSALQSPGNLRQSVPSSFKPKSLGAPRAARKNATGFFGSATYKKSKKYRSLENFQVSASASQSLPSKTGRQFQWAQMAQDEYHLKRRLINAFDQSSITNGACNSSSMVANSEQGAKESLAITNTFGIKTALSSYASGTLLERPPHGYVKAWEGDLTTKEKGQTVVVNRLVAYRKKNSFRDVSSKLVTNWPKTLHIEQLIAKPPIDDTQHEGEVEYLIVDAMNHQSKLDQLEENRMVSTLPENFPPSFVNLHFFLYNFLTFLEKNSNFSL
ncbi:Mediator of RNA polymerase II transcription subunit 25 [Camellia lanceoleosa]|uniref:Mediator of RNA polymerase II transcription subunit 25 n=1 Tax=Camellia lanceoleosa TaxID=1840588 RepID=A0ACC0F9G2_9ERIC|nr:Mediator of RNA polymerase II transcription subunit 25 [Camellia lanceoleosa]